MGMFAGNLILFALPNPELQGAQLMLVAGFVLLGWVLARRQIRNRRRVNRDVRAANKELYRIRTQTQPAVPLADAPPETQRWQIAMFDLQRDLKAELDCRISIVQTLIRQLDDRIECLAAMENQTATAGPIVPAGDHQTICELTQIGHTAEEISQRTGLPIGDIEMIMSTISPNR